jgi:hypothetical protein
MVHHLNTLWKAVNAASVVTELARQSQTYHFAVNGPMTFYLRAEQATVRVIRWTQPRIEVEVQLQAAFGWRLATDQDEAGVYLVAKRRAVVGGLSRATFSIFAPHTTYLILKIEDGQIILEHVSGTFHVPPGSGELKLEP